MVVQKTKYRLFNIYNKLFYEKFDKKLDFQWTSRKKRYQIINEIINHKKYSSYLEIGCFENETFDKIIIKKKIGVDPVSGGTIRETSDDFFKKNKSKFDICFIDGLHIYKQVKRDIFNSLSCLNDNGVILVHDCLPQSNRDQMVPRSHEHWNGDVWKIIVELRTLTNVDTYTLVADEGIGIVFNRKNRNILNVPFKNFQKLNFKYFYYNHKNIMNLISENDLLKLF